MHAGLEKLLSNFLADFILYTLRILVRISLQILFHLLFLEWVMIFFSMKLLMVKVNTVDVIG